jgi:hypothetical protein
MAIGLAILLGVIGVIWTLQTGGLFHWLPLLCAFGILWLVYQIAKKEKY